MTDAAADTGDAEMIAACDRLFDNITQKQMYVTGAVDSTPHHCAAGGYGDPDHPECCI